MAQNDVSTILTYNDEVLAKIAGKTVREVDGVLSLEGNLFNSVKDRFSDQDDPTAGVTVDVDNDEKEVKLAMDAVLEYGKSIPSVFDKITTKLCGALKDMTDLKPTEIKIHIKDVKTRDEYLKEQQRDAKGDKKKS
ncbi:Asp23/Gls24 family envelope stress response protein [Secundilactobacillus folii]|uniref:Stress response regulator gls24 homolog n=1 Tax=Secundilactobacillus folii TaxID=2678357 RepID=A0A7X2XTK8_9LACO|nr:Asp23/Gls24 family envelope stress response protein [Secundilactobacillus folii]MTV81428.1 Asp23/Gls24 family envelope stress response protein [Secundilactobacillus folii]